MFGLAILFVYSPFLHVDTSFQSIKQVQQNSTKVYFLNAAKHVDDNKDLFSASWLQPVESFLKFDTSGKNLATKQAGSNALFQSNLKKVQMTLDWLDFSVEHLSSWIHATDTLKYHHDNNVAFHVILSKLYEYIKSVVIHDSNTSMKDTIAVIAFEPWSSRTKPHVATQLSVASLAATIASMIQAGFGRVVVVGYHVQDEEYANESFRLVLSLISSKHNGGSNTTKSLLDKIQGTEMAYVRAATEEVISLQTPINIVKGALAGLQNALMSSTKRDSTSGLVPREMLRRGNTSTLTERRFDSTNETVFTALSQTSIGSRNDFSTSSTTSTATRVRLGWNEQESKQNGASYTVLLETFPQYYNSIHGRGSRLL